MLEHFRGAHLGMTGSVDEDPESSVQVTVCKIVREDQSTCAVERVYSPCPFVRPALAPEIKWDRRRHSQLLVCVGPWDRRLRRGALAPRLVPPVLGLLLSGINCCCCCWAPGPAIVPCSEGVSTPGLWCGCVGFDPLGLFGPRPRLCCNATNLRRRWAPGLLRRYPRMCSEKASVQQHQKSSPQP